MSPDRFFCGGIQHGTHHLVIGLVGVPLQRHHLLFMYETATESSIDRGLVQNQRVFNVVATVAHDGHHSVLTSGQFLKIDQFDSL